MISRRNFSRARKRLEISILLLFIAVVVDFLICVLWGPYL